MAISTSINCRNLIIYCVYVRAHSKQGSFAEVEKDLPRIKALGVDVVWFLPIHPIGKLNAKGSLGCPYSISDYRAVNPEYGRIDDFRRLTKTAHDIGLKVMIDVVYHHTSHDANLISEHPEWYRQDKDGKPQTSVPEWSDIIDLNHPHRELSEYLIGSLKYWMEQGVDGFRCDVASLLPIDFWMEASEQLRKIDPDMLWLAESVNPDFVRDRRLSGLIAHSDAEVFNAFDILYDYDIWFMWRACVAGKLPLERYIELLALQDAAYPNNFCKLRFVENHDQERVMKATATREQALAWTAFQAFNRGAFLIYGGQESAASHTPSLFEQEPVEWGNYELSQFFVRLSALKKHPAQNEGKFIILASQPCLQAVWHCSGAESLYGIFNVSGAVGQVDVQLADGTYLDELNAEKVTVVNGKLEAPRSARVIKSSDSLDLHPHVPDFWRYK